MEGLGGQRAGLADDLAGAFGVHRPNAERAQAAGFGHGGGHGRRADASHRRLDDRRGEVEEGNQIAGGGVHGWASG
jgi:hypothetical protein